MSFDESSTNFDDRRKSIRLDAKSIEWHATAECKCEYSISKSISSLFPIATGEEIN